MAYLFNLQPSEENQKTNIFGGDSGGQQQQPPDSDDKGGSADIFSSAPSGGGGVGGGGGTAGAMAPKPAASGGYNPKAANQAFQSSAQNIQQPKKLGEAQGSLASASQKLQEKANSYQQSAADKAKTYSVDDETLKGAASGDKDAYQAVADRLRKQSADQFQGFEGLGKDEPNIDYVKDPGKLFASEVGPQYTGGQSRFDAALLRKNADFVRNQQEILASDRKLRDQDTLARESETKKANDLLGSAFKDSTDAVRGKLGGYADEVVNAAKSKEAAEDQRRSQLDAKALSKADQARIKQQIRDDLKAADPRSQQARSLKYLDEDFDLSGYADIDRDTDWQEFIGENDADRYNRIGGLLGKGDILQAGKGPGADYKLRDADAYKGILGQIQGKRQAQDQASQSQLDAIRAAAAARAQEYSTRDTAQNAKESARRDLEAYINGQYANDSAQANRYLNYMFTDPSAYGLVQSQGLVRDNGPLSWQDVLTGDEVSQANRLSEDLGSLDRFKGGYRPEYDIEALKAYYDDVFGKNLKREAPPPKRPTLAKSGPAQTQKPRNDLR